LVSLLFYAVGALVIGLVAAILPARRAARLNVLEAISTE
jgi:ABC-type antimicrobial peptide transport system permease subunit